MGKDILKLIKDVIKDKEFINVATCDFKGRPNAAPKFFLKLSGNYIYLVDYIFGRTWENLCLNPKASLSFVENDTLYCYQLNGTVELIRSGTDFKACLSEIEEKQVSLSSKRIIEGVTTGKKHGNFELAISETIGVIKMKVEEVAEMVPNGEVIRHKVGE